MSGFKLDDAGNKGRNPSIREAAQALCDSVSTLGYDPVSHIHRTLVACQSALAMPERSRPDVIPDMGLAQEAIAIIRAKRPGITAGHVDALVALAELGIAELASFDLRWEADMRALRRWQSAEPERHVAALIKTGQALRDLAGGKAPPPEVRDPIADFDLALAELQSAIHGPGDRSLLWPDHADLVVWLLELLELPSSFPAIADVDRMTIELRTRVDIASGQVTPLRRAAADMIIQLADGLRYSERMRYAESQKRADALNLLSDAAQLFRKYHLNDLANLALPEVVADPPMREMIESHAVENASMAERIEMHLGLEAANDRAEA